MRLLGEIARLQIQRQSLTIGTGPTRYFDPAALLGCKAMLIGPEGSRKEIDLNAVLKSNGNLGELIKGLDLGKIDPASLLASKILLVGPDGSQKEINLADLMKSGGALNELLKGLGQPAAP